jgi:hypothetical protein
LLVYDGGASHVYGTSVPPDRFDMRRSSDTDARCALTASARREYDVHLIPPAAAARNASSFGGVHVLVPTAAQFPRQMQFGIRVRF